MKKRPLELGNYLKALEDTIIDFQGDPQTVIQRASSDSRHLGDNSLFLAVPGNRQNGIDFIPSAVKAGAIAVIAEKPIEVPSGINFIQVSDAYRATGLAAELFFDYPARKMNTLAITGTNGKTTCAFLIRKILQNHGLKTGLISTVQQEIGNRIAASTLTTPPPFELQEILFEMAERQTQWLVMEVSSHALAQGRLGGMRFNGAMFTNLSGDHCDYHGDMENYFLTKKSLFTKHLAPKSPAVVNCDDPWGQRLIREMQEEKTQVTLLSFGLDNSTDYRIESQKIDMEGSRCRLKTPGNKNIPLHSPLLGKFNLMNISGAASLADAVSIPESIIQKTTAAFHGAPGRLELADENSDFKVFVDYAHTDDALHNVLATLRELEPKRLTAVFGCGGDRDKTKRPRMGRAAAEFADRIYLTNDNPRSENPETIIREIQAGIPPANECIVIPDREQAIRKAIKSAEKGEIILIAGKGHENYQIIGEEKLPFNDRDTARKALEKI